MKVYKNTMRYEKLFMVPEGHLFLLDNVLCIVLHVDEDNNYTCYDFENEEIFNEVGTTMVQLVDHSRVSIEIE